MSRAPKVSVCIPTYNAPVFFKRVIGSLAVQDFQDYEVIVTDDSPDDSIRDILSCTALSVPLTYVKNHVKLGAPKNWNKAIGLAKGTYVKILHHDDWLLSPDSLARFVALMDDHPEASIGFSAAENYDKFLNLRFVHSPSEEVIALIRRDRNALFLANQIGPPSSIIYRNTPELIFDENLRWLVDVDFYIRLLVNRESLVYSNVPLVGVTVESDHQVTRECENNKQVEIYEHLYLYAKLSNKGSRLSHYLKFFSHLFKKFSIKSSKELSDIAPDVVIPLYLKLLVVLSR